MNGLALLYASSPLVNLRPLFYRAIIKQQQSAAMNRTPLRLALISLVCSAVIGACTPVGAVMGAGAVTGLAAYQERGVDGVARDLGTSSRIMDMFARFDHTLLKSIGVEVYEGRALLTGIVASETIRADAVRLTWQADGVVDVINEIRVSPDTSLIDTARDAWISTQLSAALTFDKQVLAINYIIETVGGTVYLLGVAQNEEELERVKNHARAIAYVQHIVSHVRLKSPAPAG
jgi:osmotically-inducible protein OsmY